MESSSAPPPPAGVVLDELLSVAELAEQMGTWDPARFVRERVGHLVIMGGPERFYKLERMVIGISGECHGSVSMASLEATVGDLRLAFTDAGWKTTLGGICSSRRLNASLS